MLTDGEIARRLPVWQAFSDLFLDTELQPDDYRRIADTLGRSDYSRAELRHILEDEVAPAFAVNLLDTAGEWTSWSEAQVREIMVRSLRSRSRMPALNWLKKRLHRQYLRREWEKLTALLDAL